MTDIRELRVTDFFSTNDRRDRHFLIVSLAKIIEVEKMSNEVSSTSREGEFFYDFAGDCQEGRRRNVNVINDRNRPVINVERLSNDYIIEVKVKQRQ